MSRTGIVGGSFDVLHDGHQALLSTAFSYGGHITVGLTSDEFAQDSRNRNVSEFEKRRDILTDSCETYSNIYNTTYEVNRIQHPLKPALETDADYIVISPEEKTQERVIEINNKRIRSGKDRLQVIEAPMVSDYDGRRISATRISNGEIDKHGRKI